MLTFAAKKHSTSANGQREDAASPFKFASAVLIKMPWPTVTVVTATVITERSNTLVLKCSIQCSLVTDSDTGILADF